MEFKKDVAIIEMTPEYHAIIQKWAFENGWRWHIDKYYDVKHKHSFCLYLEKCKKLLFDERESVNLFDIQNENIVFTAKQFIKKYIQPTPWYQITHYRIPLYVAKRIGKKSLPSERVFELATQDYVKDIPFERGGVTEVVALLDDNTCVMAYAVCSWQDNYNKKVGVKLAKKRLKKMLKKLGYCL